MQQLQLHHQRNHFQVAGIGDKAHRLSHSMVSFHVSNSNNAGTTSRGRWKVEASVLPKVIIKLPNSSVPFNIEWKHLQGLQLDDQQFGVPDSVNIIVGVDIFSHVMLHGRWQGPPGSSTALQTQFVWVLTGVVDPELDNR